MRRIEVHHVDEHAAFESAVLLVREIVVDDVRPGEIESKAQLSIDRLVRAVDAGLIAPHPVVDHDSLLVEVVQRRPVGRVGGATGECEIVIDRGSAAEERVFPVGVGSSLTRESGRRNVAFSNLALNERFISRTAENVQVVFRRRHAGLDFILHSRPASGALFRLDQDHSVRCAGAVNRGCCGVLENRDRLNVRRVECIHRIARERRGATDPVTAGLERLIAAHRNTVEHVEWLVAGADRGSAADENLRAGPGLTAVLRDLDASRATLDEVGDVRRHGGVNLVGVDLLHRAGDRESSLLAVTGRYDFLEDGRLAVESEDYGDCAAVGDDDDLDRRAEPDTSGTNGLRPGGYAADSECTVRTRDSSTAGAFDEDADISDRLLRPCVEDSAGDGACGWDRVLCSQLGRQ